MLKLLVNACNAWHSYAKITIECLFQTEISKAKNKHLNLNFIYSRPVHWWPLDAIILKLSLMQN